MKVTVVTNNNLFIGWLPVLKWGPLHKVVNYANTFTWATSPGNCCSAYCRNCVTVCLFNASRIIILRTNILNITAQKYFGNFTVRYVENANFHLALIHVYSHFTQLSCQEMIISSKCCQMSHLLYLPGLMARDHSFPRQIFPNSAVPRLIAANFPHTVINLLQPLNPAKCIVFTATDRYSLSAK